MLEREQIDYLLVNAYNAAVRAGARIMEIYQSGDLGITLKSDNTPSTLADREAHQSIKQYLGQTRIPILSEEGRNLLYEERGTWDLFWMVDPLDGTREFIDHTSHQFTVNIALMVENEPFLGVIYVPYFDKIYFSDMERGAFVKEGVKPDAEALFAINEIYQGARQLPLTEATGSPLRVAVSRMATSPDTDRFVELLRQQGGEVELVPTGSSLKFCLVAEGSVDYYVRGSLNYEWDTAAGQAIAAAAGAKTLDMARGTVLKYNKDNLENPYFYCKK
ncbi:MAG: 3'(2'),5'-bisphosphate nucleotidase CysQ [Rikenellaceae bacterium]|jgi:3'(2'), 5'-bisphosphate nucleotidase|nr:3'(2'),5'-bisphosphate nucleotidase CysQ [Rikenellaceae bacterium]